MTITYEYEGALYVNLTNRCNCNCVFCLRHGKAEGSIYTEDSLWLEHEPSHEEAMASFLSRDIPSYREIVFCGYGEPTYRIDEIFALVDELKEKFGDKLPPVRINTNGHANLINGRDVCPELKGRIDTLSISLNADNAAAYAAICLPIQGEVAYQAMLDFAGGRQLRSQRGLHHRGQGQNRRGDRKLQAHRRRAGRTAENSQLY